MVYNIQKYSVHDGPGLRTTVFLKGCPLSCLWCHNPESQEFKQKVQINQRKCIDCKICYNVCESDNCNLCLKCVALCPSEARELVGELMTPKLLYKIIKQDILFYEESQGGVTFSGGEPLCQSKELVNLLKKLKENDVHVAIDTSGYAHKESIAQIVDFVDLWLYDIKHIDISKHEELTGVGNKLIIENLEYLLDKGANIWIRFPLIPTLNDSKDNIKSIAQLLNELNISMIYLLPYHSMAEDKHTRFEIDYALKGLKEPTEEQIKQAVLIFNKHNISVQIGG